MSNSQSHPAERAVGIKLVVFWIIAGVPLLWGVANTIGNAAKMFH